MVQTTIPAKVVVTCDRCGKSCEDLVYFSENRTTHFVGDRSGCSESKYDLCSKCARLFEKEFMKCNRIE